MWIFQRTLCIVPLVLVSATSLARADVFQYRDRTGEEVTVAAKLVRTVNEAHLIALPHGEYRIISKAAIIKHERSDGPEPLTPDDGAKLLQDEFGAARFRSYVSDPYVIGLVLQSELPKSSEVRAKNFLRKVAGFMEKVSRSFKRFLKELRIPAKEPEYPLVLLIFESDDDFDKYMARVTNANPATVKTVAGFYSDRTNYLAIRLHTCQTYEVPLHEAIHQQVYNRNFFQRLAPIPNWFDEGIATGFEANNGRINIGPTKISRRYARQVLEGSELRWDKLLENDRIFLGNVLVGEAYGNAWGLHWLLVTKHKRQYLNYVKLLAQKLPLEEEPKGQREADIRDAFGSNIASLQEEFRSTLEAGLKRQRVQLREDQVAGKSKTAEGMGEVKLTAVRRLDQAGQLEVEGILQNLSPYRKLSFVVTVETGAGMYAQWHVPDLVMQKKARLPMKYVTKVMPGGSRSPSDGYRVRIRSVPAESKEAEAWSAGKLPIPVFRRR